MQLHPHDQPQPDQRCSGQWKLILYIPNFVIQSSLVADKEVGEGLGGWGSGLAWMGDGPINDGWAVVG